MEYTETELIVLGAGPGGYTAAFYAADRGKSVTLVEKDPEIGGVCLNRGCIPSKALLHASLLLREAQRGQQMGISFEKPKVDLSELRNWKNRVVHRLAQGLSGLASKRDISVIRGKGYFEDSQTLRVETEEGQRFFRFRNAIIASGSEAAIPRAFDLGSKRVLTSTQALEIEDIPENMLIIGGGYIGMELGTVFSCFGSKVVLVEALSRLLPGTDSDLMQPVKHYAEENFKKVLTQTKIEALATKGEKISAKIQAPDELYEEEFDKVLIAVGRTPNSSHLGLENTAVKTNEQGFIEVNSERRTQESNIFAIGDVAGGALLAHKAAKEAQVAVDAICGEQSSFEHVTIPAVVFTDPEIAWCGLTEQEAQERSIDIKTLKFPWSASGRALTLGRPDGLTKLIVDPKTERVLGVGLVGHGAGDLISEGVLAVEMAATARDLAETVHPHPTLSETIMESAASFYGFCVHS